MKSSKLESKLSGLEEVLNKFSFEEMQVKDAYKLKGIFESFKTKIEDKILGQGPVESIFETAEGTEQEVQSKSQRAETLIAAVSQELKTPLNGIMGFADLLQESELTDKQQGHLSAIQTKARTLIDIINELLEYSKLTRALNSVESVDFNIRRIIKDVTYLCNTLIVDRNSRLEVHVDDKIPHVLIGDPSKLTQILLNLLGNAIKFVPKGSIDLKIELRTEEENRVILSFEVQDSGIGISKQDLKQIFDSITTIDEYTFSKYGGSGLGLSIVKQLVEKLNGSLEVESTVGVGTTFRFSLPYEKSHKGTISTDQNTDLDAKIIKGKRILVFEDDLFNQKLLDQRLKMWGCDCYITDNVLYGLYILKHNAIDLVIMDIGMPLLSGYEVARAIRKSQYIVINQVPIIAISSDRSLLNKQACEEHSIMDFIIKPFSPDELLAKIINNLLEVSPQLKESSKLETQSNFTDTIIEIDLNPLLAQCMGKIDVLEKLVLLFKQNALEFMGKVKVHLTAMDFEGIAFAAHKIKCGLKMVGASALHNMAVEIHTTSRTSQDIKKINSLYRKFVTTYPKIESELDRQLNEFKSNTAT